MASDAAPIQPGVDSTAQQIPPQSYPTFSSNKNAAYSVTCSRRWRQALSTAAAIVVTVVIVVVVAVVAKNASKGLTTQPASPTPAPAAPSGPAPQVCVGPPPSKPGVNILDQLLGSSGQSTPESKSKAATWNPTVLPPRTPPPTTGSIKKSLMFRFNPEFDPVLLATLKRAGAKIGGRRLLNSTAEATPKELIATVNGTLNARNGFMPPQSLGLMLNSAVPDIAALVQRWYYSPYTRTYILHLRDELLLKDDKVADGLYSRLSSLPAGQMDFVEFATAISASAQPVATPNDPNYPYQWALQKIGLLSHAGAPPAWSVTQGSPEIIVAVMDSGVDYFHPDLEANMWSNAGEIPNNGIDDDSNGYVDDVHGFNFVNMDEDPMDDDGHGTHCAGIIAAEASNNEGIAGVAPNVKIMALKILNAGGEGRTDYQVLAIDYLLRMGVHISSNSYGGPSSTRALDAAMEKLEAAGVLLVAAAGNERADIDATPSYPAASRFKNIVSVGASDEQDCIANYSNYGKRNVDLVAPGSHIVSTVPSTIYPDGYLLMSGTSMATPHVAAAAALLLSVRYENKQPIDGQAELLKQVLLASTAKGAAFEGYVATGGRLDVANAVAMLAGARR